MRHPISDHQRVYSEAEFALILRKAAELENREDTPGHGPGGLTLAQMQAAASEVGIDPALVERAARLLPAASSGALAERLIGGPVRHGMEAHFPVALDEAGAVRLLAAGGTSVTVRLDRRDTMASIQVMAVIGFVGASTAGFVVASQVSPEVGVAAAMSGMGGIVAIARAYWASSTRRARERVSGMMEAVGRAVEDKKTAGN
jgi:hypothetical protein